MANIFVLTLLCAVTVAYAQDEDPCKEYCNKSKEILAKLDESKLPECVIEKKEEWGQIDKEVDGMTFDEKKQYVVNKFVGMDKSDIRTMVQCMDDLKTVLEDEGLEKPSEACAEKLEIMESFLKTLCE